MVVFFAADTRHKSSADKREIDPGGPGGASVSRKKKIYFNCTKLYVCARCTSVSQTSWVESLRVGQRRGDFPFSQILDPLQLYGCFSL